jgi:hypothetical protein
MTQAWNEFESDEEIVDKTTSLRQGNARIGMISGLLVTSMIGAGIIFYFWKEQSETVITSVEENISVTQEENFVQEIIEVARIHEASHKAVQQNTETDDQTENLPEISLNENSPEEPERTGCEILFSH